MQKNVFSSFFVIFKNSVNFGIVLTMIFWIKSNNLHKAYFANGKRNLNYPFAKRKQTYSIRNMSVEMSSFLDFIKKTGDDARAFFVRTIV